MIPDLYVVERNATGGMELEAGCQVESDGENPGLGDGGFSAEDIRKNFVGTSRTTASAEGTDATWSLVREMFISHSYRYQSQFP